MILHLARDKSAIYVDYEVFDLVSSVLREDRALIDRFSPEFSALAYVSDLWVGLDILFRSPSKPRDVLKAVQEKIDKAIRERSAHLLFLFLRTKDDFEVLPEGQWQEAKSVLLDLFKNRQSEFIDEFGGSHGLKDEGLFISALAEHSCPRNWGMRSPLFN